MDDGRHPDLQPDDYECITEFVREGECAGGQPGAEMVNTIHHGENRGDKDVILYMFYLSQKDLPLAVQHPEIPLE